MRPECDQNANLDTIEADVENWRKEALREIEAELLQQAQTEGFPDLGKKGNFAGLVVGMEPKLTRIDSSITASTGVGSDRDTSSRSFLSAADQ